MAMDGLPEGVPPSGRVPGQLLQAAPILKWWWRRNRGEIAEKSFCLGVSTPRAKYRRRGASRGPMRQPEGRWRGPTLGCARHPPGCLVVALLRCFGDSESFLIA